MEYRTLAHTDLTLSAITFGSRAAGGWMWGKSNRDEAVKAIKAAYDGGVTSIDTAPIYGQGESERIVGEAIRGIPRDQVQILTKFGMRWDLPQGEFAFKSKDNQDNPIDIYKYAGKESVIKECEDSLRRLGTDYIDLYQIHWPDATTPLSETFEAVERLIEQGKVRYAGVCNYDAALLEDAAKLIDLVSDQIPYSMVNRGMDRDIIPYCIRNEKSVIAYSPLERGLLTGKMQPGYRFAEGDAFLENLQPLADDKKATLGQLVIRWTIEHPGITVALVGARNPEQAIQNAKAADIILTPEELQFINQQIDQMLK